MSELVEGQKVTLAELSALAKASKSNLWQVAQSEGRSVMIYLHWSAGHYHQFYDDYHINIDDDGSIYTTTDDLSTVKAHTWHRNSGAIGVALACGAFCTSNDLAAEPPTDYQIESMARVVAVLSNILDTPIDVEHVMTHAEAANLDGYGPSTTWERWDLWFLKNGEEPGGGGNILRDKALYYKRNGTDG